MALRILFGVRPVFTYLAALLAGVLFNLPVHADTSVWKATRGSNTVYIGGTVHMLRTSDYPLPPEYDEAYEDSTEIYFETDLGAFNDISVQSQMLQQWTYTDGRTLKTVLNQAAYSALDETALAYGMSMAMMETFKPGMIITTLMVQALQRIGFTPQGVDAAYNTKAIGDSKSIGQLETVQEQIGFLASMGEGNESEFILLSLRDLHQIETVMEDMITAWRRGDTGQLSALFVDDMKREAPKLYDTLLVQRNLKWMPQIESMFTDSDTEFLLVGAAHLVGKDGILDLLRQRGYTINQL
jgi:uncharacterized protein YbaP (TraB family)